MRCEKVQEQLPAYLDASLGWLGRWRVAAHLGRCAACRRERDALARTVALVRQAGTERVPCDITRVVMGRIAVEAVVAAPASRTRRVRPVVLVPAALAAAAALALQVSVRRPAPSSLTAERPTTAYIREYAHFRASQEVDGGAGMFLLACELTGEPR